jgi:gamma-glutamyl-gamma-aminobutyraldehyde dehydrogenase
MTASAARDWHALAAACQPDGRMVIDGVRRHAASGETFECISPVDGRTLTQVARGQAADIDMAVASARRAFDDGRWAHKPPAVRKKILLRFAEKMLAAKDELALLETLDMGKPIADSLGVDVPSSARCIAWYAEAIDKVYDEIAPTARSALALITREPMGVIGAIVPWNYPMLMTAWKLGPALATGNSVVLKPSEKASLTALRLAELAVEAGLPQGVFNVVPTARAALVGDRLLDSPEVRKISFTGSTETGRKLLARAATTVKRVSMELGGNAPFIVFDDCDLDAAVAGAMSSKYRNAGQTCVCANRFLVQSGIHDRFVERLIDRTRELRVGNGANPETTVGPLINLRAVEKINKLIEASREAGASVVLGGRQHSLGQLFYQPTIVTRVTPAMPLWSEETFGPVASILRFDTEEEAIRLANGTPFGLAAYFYTTNLARSWRVGEALEYGMVAINEGILSTEVAPFGGVKQSAGGFIPRTERISRH